jgi:hypothetical protein
MRNAVAQAYLAHVSRALLRPRLHDDLFAEVDALREAFVDEAWTEIGRRASRCLGFGYAAMQTARTEIADAAAKRKAAAAVLEAEIALLRRRPENGGGDDPGEPVPRRREVRVSTALCELAIACLSRGLLALVHLSFQSERERRRPERELVQVALTDALAADVARRAELANADLRSLQELAASGSDAGAIVGRALGIATALERDVPPLGAIQAKAFALVELLRARNEGARAASLGAVAAQGGALIRQLLATHAACWRLVFELEMPEPSRQVTRLIDDAADQPFDAPLPTATPLPIGSIAEANEGEFVEVGGFVRSVSASRPADKLISTIDLEDAVDGSHVPAMTVFTHLPHRGITPGAYVRLQGSVRVVDGGNRLIQIQRLPIAELGRAAWRFALLRLGERWFATWPNGIHVDWMIGPHRSGAGEHPEPTCGACEVIFPPLVRRA